MKYEPSGLDEFHPDTTSNPHVPIPTPDDLLTLIPTEEDE